jgi:isopentenyl diphosphate isomerase/L-lactate dehydrogenase-like FMN-dependent dehydrogenase
VTSYDGSLARVADYEFYARQISAPAMYDWLYGEPGDSEWTSLTNNCAAFSRVHLRARVLAGLTDLEARTSVLGHEIRAPVVVGPTGILGGLDPLAELSAIRGAHAAGTIFVLSGAASLPVEDVAAAADGVWFQQLWLLKDRDRTQALAQRARELGAAALVLTVSNAGDTFHTPVRRFAGVQQRPQRETGSGTPPLLHDVSNLIDPAIGWNDVDWLRSVCDLPLIVKGIQTKEDAYLVLEHDVDAIVVSNHGGRFLQGSRGTLDMLPEVVAAVGDRLEVYVDGGVRTGEDVLKALAIGARACWIGRPARWGQAVAGADGVAHVVEILRTELLGAMALCGVADAREVPRELVTPATFEPTIAAPFGADTASD